MAPVISAGVMMAKVIWYAQNSTNGMVEQPKKSTRRQGRADVLQPREVEVADEPAVAGVAEGQAEDDRRPQDADQAHGEEVLHEHAEDVLGPDHPPKKRPGVMNKPRAWGGQPQPF